jgi:hypothetical protein
MPVSTVTCCDVTEAFGRSPIEMNTSYKAQPFSTAVAEQVGLSSNICDLY